MICSFLVHCGATAEEAIRLYGEKRTLDGCGVTIPSQLRYIRYYEQFLESRTLNYDPRLLSLHEIVINTIPKPLLALESGRNYLILTIMSSNVKIYESLPQHSHIDLKNQVIRIGITDKIVLAGDSHLCHFFFNTTFIDSEDSLFMNKAEIDKACKDKLHSIFDKNLSIQVKFSPALAQQSPLPTLDSLPNRAILLKYKNHEGPNSVQITPPYFTTRKLSPRNNAINALTLFGIQSSETPTGDESTVDCNVSTPSSYKSLSPSLSPPHSGSSTSTSLLNAKIQSKASSKPFKPVWAEKDRDRDDNWDASSVNSDCSESDASLEWWYTKPPRVTVPPVAIVSGVHTHTVNGTAETTTEGVEEQGHTISPPVSIVSGGYSIVPISNSGSGSLYQQPIHSKPNVHGIMSSPLSSHSGNSKSPPHSGSSPLAREIKFDSVSRAGGQEICDQLNSALLGTVTAASFGDEKDTRKSSSNSGSLGEGSFVLEQYPHEIDEGRDSGIESIHSKDQDHDDLDRDKGWVDSFSRWLWTDDGKMEINQHV
ncbi:hypothetical protein BG004_004435 [Podila humilis]|nr:hypothetical protein BG004_004435 [Podila humilis]